MSVLRRNGRPVTFKLLHVSTLVADTFFFSFVILLFLSFPGDFQAVAVPYDHSFTHECLATPLRPQYGGGIVTNAQLNKGSKGWKLSSNQTVEIQKGKDGNNFMVATRLGNQTSAVQRFQLEADKLYTFSAWVQTSSGNAHIKAVFKISNDEIPAGWVTAQAGCWSMLKGGIQVNVTTLADLYFATAQDDPSTADIWVDNISLQPFTQEEWKSHQDQSIEKVRKGKVIFQAVDDLGRPVSNATVSIKQTRPDFPFGCAINKFILNSTKYQEWFTSRFKYYTVLENELKWRFLEYEGPKPDYHLVDNLLKFAESKGIQVRGHTIHWGSNYNLPPHLINVSFTPEKFRELVYDHTDSLVNRYKGKLMHWDVVNENIRQNDFDTILGDNAASLQFQRVHNIDPKPLLFLNDYFTIEKSDDGNTSAWKYLQKIWQIQKYGYNGPLGIGIQGHFSDRSLPYIRSSLDILESTKLPIWITELDVNNSTYGELTVVAQQLEEIIRELHAHRSVKGVMLWSAMWESGRCYRVCLTDPNFVNLPTGDVVDKILAEWNHADGVQGTTNSDGGFETSLYHGDYEAEVSYPGIGASSCEPVKFRVMPGGNDTRLVVKVVSASTNTNNKTGINLEL